MTKLHQQICRHCHLSHTLSKTEKVWCGDHVVINDVLRFSDRVHLFRGHLNRRTVQVKRNASTNWAI